jgi:hypothetical protein
MSLLHLVHKSVVIKFAELAKSQYNPEALYGFRLTGVDAMGFLQIQDLRLGAEGAPETASEPYWINKDFIREIHEIDLATAKGTILYTGEAAAPPQVGAKVEPKIEPAPREVSPKLPKAKTALKPKSVLKQKPVFN